MIECLSCGRPRFTSDGCDRNPCAWRIEDREASARFWPGPVVRTDAEIEHEREIAERADRERRIRGLYEAARRALRLAREYRVGDATSDYRIKAITRRVYFIRQDIAALRAA